MTRKPPDRSNLVYLPSPAAQRYRRALAALRAVIASKGLHMTGTRASILRATLERPGHFDADTLAKSCRMPVSTLYRNLPLMVEARILRAVPVPRGERHLYEVTFERGSHEHLVCRTCGAVLELHFEGMDALRTRVAAAHEFELTSHAHEILGTCAECSARAGD